ncbi:hypothetical protein Lal_00033581 [Lupinus albus]|nr:hypothetical protein Lal_00033581 [Lupinus albus]
MVYGLDKAQLKQDYNIILRQEDMLWFQKSKEQWAKFGDRNTKYIHTQTIARIKRKNIYDFFLDGCVYPVTLKDKANRYFQAFFVVATKLILTTPMLSQDGIVRLVKSIALEEVTKEFMSI